MAVISELADFISGASFATLPRETTEHLKMHLLDTIGAMLVGPQTREGVAIGKLLGQSATQGNIPVIGYQVKAALLPSIIASCAATRCSEIDDIHLESCTTPGSVVIPTALSLANAGYLSDPKDFLVAVALGYEMLTRLGMAANGPKVLYQGVWPTYLGATLCGAAVAARALKLNAKQTTSAIATALTMSTGVAGRPKGAPSSRWLTVGVAAQNGVIAALSAQEGFVGDEALLDRTSGRICGLKLSLEKLTDNLGQRFFIDETGMKPYPVARQALPAVEAFREIVANNKVNPELIKEVVVWVPRRFMLIIDRPKLPDSRLESVSSVQYQIALAAFAPKNLIDAKRDRLAEDSKVRALIEKVHVRPSRELERYYPSVWSARVEVKEGGRRYSCKMLYPKGDSRNRLSWDEVMAKFSRLAQPALGEAAIEQVTNLVRKLDASTSMAHLLGSIVQ